LGAGAGGCAALLCNPMQVSSVRSDIERLGWEIIDWNFEEEGVAIC